MADRSTCTNSLKVDKLIREEPDNFYDEMYEILDTDCDTFDISEFKRFYIVRRLPLYNINRGDDFKKALQIVEKELSKNDKNMNRIFNTLIEEEVGHKKGEYGVNIDNINFLYHYHHNKLGKVITSPLGVKQNISCSYKSSFMCERNSLGSGYSSEIFFNSLVHS